LASDSVPLTPIDEGHREASNSQAAVKKGTGWIAKGLLLLVPVIIGAFAGAAAQYYMQMARPQATLLDVRLPSPQQVKGEKDRKIQVPTTLYELTSKSEFFKDLERQSTRQEIANLAENLSEAKSEIPDQQAWIDTWSPKLDGNLTLEEKRTFLQEMEVNDIEVILSTGLVVNDGRYKPSASEKEGPILFPYQPTKTGFQFNLGLRIMYLEADEDSAAATLLKPGADTIATLLKPGADAIATFNQKYLKRVLLNAREDLNRKASESAEIADRIKKLINHSEGLHVRVLVVNKGGSPVSLTPWGTLRLFATGNQPDVVIPLRASEDSYPSIKPGESQELNLDSVESAEQIESKFPLLENILKSETVMCRLALKRADITGDSGWIRSSTRTLTANEDAEPETHRVGEALTR